MKKTTLTFVLLTVFTLKALHSQEINWIKDQALAIEKAEKESKQIHIYAYTSWCGPCRNMKKNIFTNNDVIDFYNKNFVNLALDMEIGQGLVIAEKYNVVSYPTFLFVNGDGKLLHKSIGARGVEEFIGLGKNALNPESQLITMRKKYENGERSSDFLKSYIKLIASAESTGHEEIALEYLENQQNWKNADNLEIILNYSEPTITSPLFKYILENKEDFIAKFGKESVNEKIKYAANRDRKNFNVSVDDKERALQHYKKYYTEEEAKLQYDIANIYKLMYSDNQKDKEKFLTEAQLFMSSLPDVGSNMYNSVAWEVYMSTDDRDLLSKAELWTKKSISEKSNSYNNDTMAHILTKLGKSEEAKKYAIESIKLAKQEGVDASLTEQLLQKLNQ